MIDSVMLRLLPVQRPQELAAVLLQMPGRPAEDGFTNPLWEAIRERQDVFAGVFAWSSPKPFAFAQGGAVHDVQGLMVSGDYFTTLGVTPRAGRLLIAADDHRGCTPVAVLGYGFWQTQFGGMDSALGTSISLNHESFQVIGVSPPQFHGVNVGRDFDVAIPLCASALFDKRNLDSRSRWWLSIIGREKPGIPSDQIQARLGVLSPEIMTAALPDWDAAGQQRFLAEDTGHHAGRHRSVQPAQRLQRTIESADGHRGARALGRLREYRQPDAGARNEQRERDCDSQGAGCVAKPSHSPTAHRICTAVVDRRCDRSRPRRRSCPRPRHR